MALFAGYAVAIGALLLSLRRDRELSYMVTLMATLSWRRCCGITT